MTKEATPLPKDCLLYIVNIIRLFCVTNALRFIIKPLLIMRYLLLLVFLTFLSNESISAQCKDCYETPFLGVYSNGITKKKSKQLQFDNSEGSYVTGIIGNTAAERAALQPFDYIYGINGYRTDNGRSLTSILKKFDPGDEVVVHFYRNGKKQQKNTILGTRSDAEYNKRSKREDPFLGVEQRGRDSDDDFFGVKVNIVSKSTAKGIGLENGDIITHINGFPIIDWTDLGTAIDMMTVGNETTITYVRGGRKSTSSGKIKSLAETKYNDYNSNSKKNYSYSYKSDGGKSTRVEVWTNSDTDSEELNSRDLDGMQVSLADISSGDIRQLSDLDLPQNNDLSVDGLTFTPNKNMGHFDLIFSLSSKGETVIDIFNDKGRSIYNYDLGSFSGDFEDRIDLAQNGTGTYYLKIVQGNKGLAKAVNLSKN